jgi:antitoxin component of MazEF toxin-antitoxin module
MAKSIQVKLRRIGTSIGVLIPKSVLRDGNFKLGQSIEISLVKRPTKKEIEKAFGSAKWLKGFKREKGDMDRF